MDDHAENPIPENPPPPETPSTPPPSSPVEAPRQLESPGEEPLQLGEPAGPASAEPEGEAGPPLSPEDFWCELDEHFNVRQKSGPRFEGRVIGQIRGKNLRAELAPFRERFRRLEERCNVLEREIGETGNKGRFSDRVGRAIEMARSIDGLGDFDGLLGRLETLQATVLEYQNEQNARKEELILKVEPLAASHDWTGTAEKMKKAQEEWKTLGSAGRQADEELWKRFRGTLDQFFHNRDENRKHQAGERDSARQKKEELCAQAEGLAESKDWEATFNQFNEMMTAWKAAGWAGREAEEALWNRFRAARNSFSERRRGAQSELRHQRDENRQRKENLCTQAEALTESPDAFGACEQAKLLQAEWKTVGPVPRAVSEPLWERFRGACDKVFARASSERKTRRADYSHQREETLTRKREQAENLRESISRDQGHLDRWRQALTGLREGPRADEMRQGLTEKMNSVEERLAAKRARLQELETEIQALQAR